MGPGERARALRTTGGRRGRWRRLGTVGSLGLGAAVLGATLVHGAASGAPAPLADFVPLPAPTEGFPPAEPMRAMELMPQEQAEALATAGARARQMTAPGGEAPPVSSVRTTYAAFLESAGGGGVVTVDGGRPVWVVSVLGRIPIPPAPATTEFHYADASTAVVDASSGLVIEEIIGTALVSPDGELRSP